MGGGFTRRVPANWIPFRDHPIKLVRYGEDQHGPSAGMTRTSREVYQFFFGHFLVNLFAVQLHSCDVMANYIRRSFHFDFAD